MNSVFCDLDNDTRPGGAGEVLLRSRLAPTPSGYLHLGNACNFILTWLLVRHRQGVLKLRIDDADSGRSRREYLEDIFRQLEWLGLDWDAGPNGPDDFTGRHSQMQRLERYRRLLTALSAGGQLFYCTCSRRQISQSSAATGLYPGTCCQRRQPPPAAHAVRIMAPPELELGDFVLWRRDDLPAYQLASLADDLADGSNLIVRGRDLASSSAAQLFLARQLGAEGRSFRQARFLHHPLLRDGLGRKLAKSDQSLSLAAIRQAGATPMVVYRQVADLLGLDSTAIASLTDLQAAFSRLLPSGDLATLNRHLAGLADRFDASAEDPAK